MSAQTAIGERSCKAPAVKPSDPDSQTTLLSPGWPTIPFSRYERASPHEPGKANMTASLCVSDSLPW